jgi:hypothetical protein
MFSVGEREREGEGEINKKEVKNLCICVQMDKNAKCI